MVAVSWVSISPAAVMARPARMSGSRGPRAATIRPDSGAQRIVIAAMGTVHRPACRAE